ncbi:hypothetical protein ACG9XL_02650 [Acinetobacter nosocomialis]|uniref:hypothetical protein n=1 Tax=Acinetobacter nosocomialis TaxID=106654 RepID=UPI003AF50EB8
MEVIYKLWVWLGNNSGQIQIIIALVAFWLAYKGYVKVLEQIQISREQDKVNYEQRSYELKTKVISLLFEVNESLHTKLKILHELYNVIEKAKIDGNSEESETDLEESLRIVKDKIEETESFYEKIIDSTEIISNEEIFDYQKYSKKLNVIYNALLLSTRETNNIEIMKAKYNFED